MATAATITAPHLDPHQADAAEELLAGRRFPMRDWRKGSTPEAARALLRARSDFWLAVADAHLKMAENGCDEAFYDAQDAFACHRALAPR